MRPIEAGQDPPSLPSLLIAGTQQQENLQVRVTGVNKPWCRKLKIISLRDRSTITDTTKRLNSKQATDLYISPRDVPGGRRLPDLLSTD